MAESVPILIGVHRQIAVALRGEVPHHQLGGGTMPAAVPAGQCPPYPPGPPDALPHFPVALRHLSAKLRCRHWCSGLWCREHGGILHGRHHPDPAKRTERAAPPASGISAVRSPPAIRSGQFAVHRSRPEGAGHAEQLLHLHDFPTSEGRSAVSSRPIMQPALSHQKPVQSFSTACPSLLWKIRKVVQKYSIIIAFLPRHHKPQLLTPNRAAG